EEDGDVVNRDGAGAKLPRSNSSVANGAEPTKSERELNRKLDSFSRSPAPAEAAAIQLSSERLEDALGGATADNQSVGLRRKDSTLSYYRDLLDDESPTTAKILTDKAPGDDEIGDLAASPHRSGRGLTRGFSTTSLDTHLFGDFTYTNVQVLGEVNREMRAKTAGVSALKEANLAPSTPPLAPMSKSTSNLASEDVSKVDAGDAFNGLAMVRPVAKSKEVAPWDFETTVPPKPAVEQARSGFLMWGQRKLGRSGGLVNESTGNLEGSEKGSKLNLGESGSSG
ncbi:hypothetical protein HK101_007062, partial [Irineochytrium annulatum]